MIKKTWIIPHEAVEISGWMFLNNFDVLKLYLPGLPAKAAKVRVLQFWKKAVYRRGMLERKKKSSIKTSKGEKLMHKK